MPWDIKREFFICPRQFSEIVEKLEVIITEMIADDTSGPMDLVNINAQDSKSSFGDDEPRHGVSYDDTCAIACVGTTLAGGV